MLSIAYIQATADTTTYLMPGPTRRNLDEERGERGEGRERGNDRKRERETEREREEEKEGEGDLR